MAPFPAVVGGSELDSNHFAFSFRPMQIFRYEVTLMEDNTRTIDSKTRLKRRAVSSVPELNEDSVIYDGDKILLSKEELKSGSFDAHLNKSSLQVVLTFVGVVELSPDRVDQEQEQILTLIFHKVAGKKGDHLGGNKYFDHRAQPKRIVDAMQRPPNDFEARSSRGFYIAVGHRQTVGPRLNSARELLWTLEVNSASNLWFPEMPLMTLLMELAGCCDARDLESALCRGPKDQRFVADRRADPKGSQLTAKAKEIALFIKGHTGLHDYRGERKEQRILGLEMVNARTHKFETGDGVLSVERFLKDKYNVTLKHPTLPMVRLDPGKMTDIKVLLPIELVRLDRQRCAARTPLPVKNMVNGIMTQDPRDRRAHILHEVKSLLECGKETLATFNIHLKPTMLRVRSHVNRPPTLKYAGRELVPKPGSWNIVSHKFTKGSSVAEKWGFVDLSGMDMQDTRELCCAIGSNASSFGMQILVTKKPSPLLMENMSVDSLSDEAKRCKEDEYFPRFLKDKVIPHAAKSKLIFFVLPGKDNSGLYAKIKSIVEPLCTTQCMQREKMQWIGRGDRGRDQYLQNVLAKVNTKLGGVNHTLADKQSENIYNQIMTRTGGVLLLGADQSDIVIRSGINLPTVAAVVGSSDKEGVSFNHAFCCQEKRVDAIESMQRAIETINLKNGKWPPNVIFFRDGVSDNAIEITGALEVQSIEAAYLAAGKCRPRVTYIVVQKRHQTRFFTTSVNADKRENPTPGSVVMDDLLRPGNMRTFYVMSQHGIKGTTNPCRYFIYKDDVGLSNAEWAKFGNHMCYLFSRATKSVSYPSATYYAHLACDQARLVAATILAKELNLSGTFLLSEGGVDLKEHVSREREAQLAEEMQIEFAKALEELGKHKKMFYV